MKTLLLFLSCLIAFSVSGQNVLDTTFIKAGIIKAPSQPETFPIRIWDDFILIDLKVNGVDGTFIWDNGLSVTALDSSFARKVGVFFNKHKEDSVIDGNDKRFTLKAQYVKKLSIGQFSIDRSPVLGLNIDYGIFKNKEVEISGLIGGSFSNHFNWDFNFEKKTVTLSKKPFVKEGIKLKYQIDPDNDLHFFPLTLNGTTFLAQVDFGMVGESFSGGDEFGQLFVGHPTIKSIGYKSISAGGLSPLDTIFTIRGDYNFLVSGQKVKELPDIDLSGGEMGFKIGVRFFQHYNTIINNTDSNYILYERKIPLKPRTKKGYGIFVLKKKDAMYIGKLTNNPNLNGKEIGLMDKVASINGKTASNFYGLIDLRDFQEKLLLEGKALELKMDSGQLYSFFPQEDIAD